MKGRFQKNEILNRYQINYLCLISRCRLSEAIGIFEFLQRYMLNNFAIVNFIIYNNMTSTIEVEDKRHLQFKHPFSLVAGGPSGSGKTYLVRDILEHHKSKICD